MKTREPKVEVLKPGIADHSKKLLEDVIEVARGTYENAELCLINCRRRSDGKVVDLLAIISIHEGSEERRIEPVAEVLGEDAVDRYDPPDTRSRTGFRTREGRSLG